ncbi:prepilin peptidase-dependent pilin [Arsenophonus sp.]|uniref:prepilin peptidase-dependent pilin n=2 Tax=unclassified Arsenophonus TaxID=2627083 RepID=UPI00285D1529|nr:prepilin peptidase-dependent pilin [Arsenophonus sp.]MDR5609564.1 prepilin peptidase-dependent pilin [Arsenophonus sp.]MDR5613294.1 prepilin peptidase-dependent pilin [Arsenophonus sp.]
MMKQQGFSLMEIMVAIAIIAVLSAISIPSYKSYMQKASLTDMLQFIVPYKMHTELCGFENGHFTGCHNGISSIPTSKTGKYVSNIDVKDGIIKVVGTKSLKDLTITLEPTLSTTDNRVSWKVSCESTDSGLKKHCADTFRF